MQKLKVFGIFLLSTGIIYFCLYHTNNLMNFSVVWRAYSESRLIQAESYSHGCVIPQLNPFDPSIMQYYRNISGDIPCTGKRYMDVVNNTVVLNETRVQLDFPNQTFRCTKKAIIRNPKNLSHKADNKFEYGTRKVLNFNVPLPEEFIKVFCTADGKSVYEEFLATTPLKPSVEDRCSKAPINDSDVPKMNIIVVGIDSISKLNFERHFKKTAAFIRSLPVIELHGYMKVADNTFPNLTPMLTGHFVEHYYTEQTRDMYFDDLEFLWKNFSRIGYRTLLAEDAPDMATYNYMKNGFRYPPTDYFFRPLTIAIEDSPWQMAGKKHCFHAKPEILVLFDYFRSFLQTMEDRPYFAFTWAARLTHGDVNMAGYADKPSYELLKDIRDMGLLNNSVVLFMSDHGIRFGGIRKTYIGKIEERMPFMFISFPQWFLKKYPYLAANLKLNQNRMTTPFDIHETLVDVYQMISKNYDHKRTPYGISLFDEIPVTRTCEDAFILKHWCPCGQFKPLPIHDPIVNQVANAVLNAINNMTGPLRSKCSMLSISSIMSAMISVPESDMLKYTGLKNEGDENSVKFSNATEPILDFSVNIKTDPGGGEFESTVMYAKNVLKVQEISRINMYGSQGDCIDDSNMRKYCYCGT